jgi:hypothetical protein
MSLSTYTYKQSMPPRKRKALSEEEIKEATAKKKKKLADLKKAKKKRDAIAKKAMVKHQRDIDVEWAAGKPARKRARKQAKKQAGCSSGSSRSSSDGPESKAHTCMAFVNVDGERQRCGVTLAYAEFVTHMNTHPLKPYVCIHDTCRRVYKHRPAEVTSYGRLDLVLSHIREKHPRVKDARVGRHYIDNYGSQPPSLNTSSASD